MFASVEGVVRGCEEEEVGSVRAVLKLDFSKVVSGNNGCDWTGQGEAMTADIEARRKQRRHGHRHTLSASTTIVRTSSSFFLSPDSITTILPRQSHLTTPLLRRRVHCSTDVTSRPPRRLARTTDDNKFTTSRGAASHSSPPLLCHLLRSSRPHPDHILFSSMRVPLLSQR